MDLKIKFILVLFLSQFSYGQKITIEWRYKFKANLSDSLEFGIQRPSLKISDGNLKEINYVFYKSDSMNISISTFEIFDTTIGLIQDIFGHEIVLFPSSDTAIINITPMEVRDSGMLNKTFRNPGLFLFKYSGKNKAFYELFDSLAYLTGAVHMTNTGLRSFNNNIQDYFTSITNTFHDRLNYANKIFKQNSFPINIQNLVLKDIESSYINGLLEPLSDEQFNDVSKYPNEYVDSLSKRDFGNLDYFKKTFNYQYAAINYATLFLNKFDNNNPYSNQQLINRYAVVKKHFSGEVQSNLLITTLELFLKARPNSLDSLMNDFRSVSFSPKYVSYLDSVNNIVKANAKTFEATLYHAINTEIFNVKGRRTKFKKLLFKRPVMIDCWASWCAPCIYQMSFMTEIEKEYRNKIDFIYLSFDKNKNSWTKKSETLKLNYSDNYLLPKNFKSDFANYFDITSIPRYILFDKHGKVITGHAPRPSRKEALKKILDNAINGR